MRIARRCASRPNALGLLGSDLVANMLIGHLVLELREREQVVEHEPPRRRGCVELLGDRYEAHTIVVARAW